METVMITLKSLQEKQASHLALKAEQGQSWDHVYGYNLRLAIAVMQHRGLESVHSIGNFIKDGIKLPTAEQTVVIPKGLVFQTLRPGIETDLFKTDRHITVHSISIRSGTGFHEEYSDDPASIRELPIEIKWAGKGSYWCSVTLNDWIESGGYDMTQAFEKKRVQAMQEQWLSVCREASLKAKGITVSLSAEDGEYMVHNGPCQFVEAAFECNDDVATEIWLPLYTLKTRSGKIIQVSPDDVLTEDICLKGIYNLFSHGRNPEGSHNISWEGPHDLIANADEAMKQGFLEIVSLVRREIEGANA
jgi:hypothetical protein